jgi:site-specific recombinase XerD
VETQSAIDRYLASPALSEATQRAYRVDLDEFATWLEAEGTTVEALDARMLAAYAAELGAARAGRDPRTLAPATIARKSGRRVSRTPG